MLIILESHVGGYIRETLVVKNTLMKSSLNEQCRLKNHIGGLPILDSIH